MPGRLPAQLWTVIMAVEEGISLGGIQLFHSNVREWKGDGAALDLYAQPVSHTASLMSWSEQGGQPVSVDFIVCLPTMELCSYSHSQVFYAYARVCVCAPSSTLYLH